MLGHPMEIRIKGEGGDATLFLDLSTFLNLKSLPVILSKLATK